MKNRLRTAASLLLLVSVLGSSGLLAYSTEQTLTPGLAKIASHGVGAVASNIGLGQTAPSSPCLTPSAADISSAQVQPGSSNSSIPGSVVPDVRFGRASRTGTLPFSQQIQLELVFSLRNPTQFNQCLNSIMEPQSANYGNFLNATTLTPYLPTPGQKASVSSFLTNAGFTITQGASPLVLQLSGTVASTEFTFGVTLNYYQAAGHASASTFYAINTDPTLPTAYANLVTGIIGLDNYSTPRPVESPCTGPYCPQGIQVGYSLTSLYSAGDNGAGQTVAVVDAPGDQNPQLAINTFDSQYGLQSVTLNLQYPDGTPSSYDPGWAAEAAMDIEAVHSVAPGAGIVLLYDQLDLMNAVDYVASHSLAKVVSNSWTYICGTNMPCSDTQLSSTFVMSIDSRLATDVAQGLTILFASGDNGAKPDGTVLGTEFPSSDPNVLAVGATNLVLTGCTTNTCTGYSSETGATISGGGYSGFFSEPSWQTSTIGSTASKCTTGHMHSDCRAVPDVAMLGGINPGPGIWVYSSSVKACVGGSLDGGGWFGCSGTSLSTPLWAGFLAIALQIRNGNAFGNIGPLLYQTANNAILYAADFHDITSGNNGYAAGTGWDPVTGWGSPVASSLAFTLGSTVTFNTVPGTFPLSTTPGSIMACGTTFTNGEVGSQDNCTPSFTAIENLPTPTTGWQFDHWSWTGGVSCSSSTLTTTVCTFTSSGSLTAIFRAQVTFTITSALATIGWGTCAGPGQPSGSMPYETNFGTVSACYVPIGYSVLSWVCSLGLSCSGSSGVTPVTFTGPGTITLNLQSGSISSPAQTNITASPSTSNPTHGTMFTVSGQLRLVSSGVGIGSEPIVCVFSWSSSIVTVTTQTGGSVGAYTCNATAPNTTGPYNVDVFFLGDYTHGPPQYLPSKATAMITVS